MEGQDMNYDYSSNAGVDMSGGYDPNAMVQPQDPYAGLNDEQRIALEEEFRVELAKVRRQRNSYEILVSSSSVSLLL
jgi:hypothetical protein